LKALPEDTRNIPILLTEFEVNGFKDKKWLETREKMVGYIFKTYPHVYSPQEQEQLINNLDEARNKNYIYETAIVQYAVAKQSAVKNGRDFATLEKQLEQKFPAPLARAIQLFNLLNLEQENGK
ncbi:MAG: hypothetical protein E7J79_09930, partial [Aggregatibacter aphrophilus]|nr:hypothetical protein [Aggregatibacter aphrophilus]